MIELLLTCTTFFAATPPPVAEPPVMSVLQDDEEEEVEDNRKLVKELLTKLKGHVKKKGKEDAEAIQVIDELYSEFAESGPKDRAAIVKELEKCFKAKRKTNDQGERNNSLFIACAVSLGSMGPESVKPLIGLIGHKSHRADMLLQEKLILALGKTKDERAVQPLVDLLKHHDKLMQASGAEALGNFGGLEQKQRKEVFEDLLKTLMQVHSKMDADPRDIPARERYDAVSGPIITTLRILTDHEENSPEAWQRWWNKNKKADWDEKDD